MYASAEQVTAQQRRTARSHRFLIRLGILLAALAAAFMVGTAAAQADDESIVEDESATSAQLPDEGGPADESAPVAEPEPADEHVDDGIIEDEGGGKPPAQDESSLTDVAGAAAVVPDVVADTANVVEEAPVAGAAAPVVDAAADVVRDTVATSGKVVGGVEDDGSQTVDETVEAISQGAAPEGLPEDLQDTANSAVAPILDLVPGGVVPGSGTPDHEAPNDGPLPSRPVVVPPDLGGFERGPEAVALPASTASRAATNGAQVGARPAGKVLARSTSASAGAAAATSSDLGGDLPLNELLGGDHGVVSGGSGAGVADRATPASASYGDRAGLVSDPVRTDARPHTAPVARPEFAPD